MKKFLSLLLALAMAFSLVTFSAGAAEFTDSSSIQYKDAVDVIAALNIMGGYNDGSFGPANYLSRGAASKIICNLSLTPSIADSITAGSTRFTDVPSTSSYSGYVAWCYNRNIVSGYSDGSFHPYDRLSGNAYLKMLLGVLGYDQNIEGYSGTGWANNVRIQAQQIGLIDASFNGSDPVTREMAAQLAFLTLQADEVEYSGTTRNSRQYKTSTSAASINSDNHIQFAEDPQHFPGLKKESGYKDAFGRPGTRWTLNGSEVGVYLNSANRDYYTDVAASRIYSDLNLSGQIAAANITLYVNGEEAKLASDAVISSSNSKTVSQLIDASDSAKAQKINNNGNGDGVEIQVFRNGSAVTITAITYYPGVINSVETPASGRYVVVRPADGTDASNRPAAFDNASNAKWRYTTSSFASGDPVAYTYTEAGGVQDVLSLDSRSGTLNGKSAGASLRLGSSTYPYANMAAFSSGDETALTIGQDYTVYLLTLGGTSRILWVANVAAASADGYALVTMLRAGDSLDNTNARARLLFADGSVSNVTLDRVTLGNLQALDSNDDVSDYYIVSYNTASNGNYTLNRVADNNFATSGSFTVTSGSNSLSSLTGANGNALTANNSTRFVIHESSGYRSYTGYRNIPNVRNSSHAFAYYTTDTSGANIAQVVFVIDGDISTTSRDLTFISAKSASRVTQESGAPYRTFRAVVNGQITTLQVEVGATLDDLDINDEAAHGYTQADNVILNSVESSDGLVINGSYASAGVAVYYAEKGIRSLSNSEISLNNAPEARSDTSKTLGSTLDLASNVRAYVVAADGAITASAPGSISVSSSTDAVLFTYDLDNNQITNLFVLKNA